MGLGLTADISTVQRWFKNRKPEIMDTLYLHPTTPTIRAPGLLITLQKYETWSMVSPHCSYSFRDAVRILKRFPNQKAYKRVPSHLSIQENLESIFRLPRIIQDHQQRPRAKESSWAPSANLDFDHESLSRAMEYSRRSFHDVLLVYYLKDLGQRGKSRCWRVDTGDSWDSGHRFSTTAIM